MSERWRLGDHVTHLASPMTSTSTTIDLADKWTAETPYMAVQSQVRGASHPEIVRIVDFVDGRPTIVRGHGGTTVCEHFTGAYVWPAWPD